MNLPKSEVEEAEKFLSKYEMPLRVLVNTFGRVSMPKGKISSNKKLYESLAPNFKDNCDELDKIINAVPKVSIEVYKEYLTNIFGLISLANYYKIEIQNRLK